MGESPLVRIVIALIGAIAVIVAAWIGASAKHRDDGVAPQIEPSVGEVEVTSKPTDLVEAGSVRSSPESVPITTQEGNSSKPTKRYETIATVFEGKKAFVDPETGFVFAVEDVINWRLPSLRGATCRYNRPDGTFRRGGRDIGYSEEFRYKGRDFIMVIEDMDFERNSVTIRIKEI